MNTVVTTVCNNFESGTNHLVFLKFKTYKFTPSLKIPYTCETNNLDTGKVGISVNDWARGSTQTWGHKSWNGWILGFQEHNFLGSCAKDFRPYDQLMFQVVTPLGFVVFYHEQVEICKLVVTFGANNSNEREVWEWSQEKGVSSWNNKYHIVEYGREARTDWLRLERL